MRLIAARALTILGLVGLIAAVAVGASAVLATTAPASQGLRLLFLLALAFPAPLILIGSGLLLEPWPTLRSLNLTLRRIIASTAAVLAFSAVIAAGYIVGQVFVVDDPGGDRLFLLVQNLLFSTPLVLVMGLFLLVARRFASVREQP